MHFQSTYYKNVNNFWTNFSVIVLIFCITRRWISFSIKYHKCVLKPLDPECSSLVEDGLAFVLSQHISLYVSYTRLLHISACHSICLSILFEKKISCSIILVEFSVLAPPAHTENQNNLCPVPSTLLGPGTLSQHTKVVIAINISKSSLYFTTFQHYLTYNYKKWRYFPGSAFWTLIMFFSPKISVWYKVSDQISAIVICYEHQISFVTLTWIADLLISCYKTWRNFPS